PLLPRALRPMLGLAPASVPGPSAVDRPQVFPAEGAHRMRVALLPGCAQQVLAPEINEATIRLLTRHGCEVLFSAGSGCCGAPEALRVAYHSACSLQHGQKIDAGPKELLDQAGFEVVAIPEGHLCCGSAGTYNLLQPELAGALRDRKLANIAVVGADLVAAGNIGCIKQLASGGGVPVVHTVELLDWATGGPRPRALATRA